MSGAVDAVEAIPDWAVLTAAVATIVTALGVIWRNALRPLVQGVTKIADRIEIVNEVPEKLETLAFSVTALARTVERIDRRTRQLEPNAGTSMADKVARIERNTEPKEQPS